MSMHQLYRRVSQRIREKVGLVNSTNADFKILQFYLAAVINDREVANVAHDNNFFQFPPATQARLVWPHAEMLSQHWLGSQL